MAYTAGNLHLRAGAPGDLSYTYDAGSDALATVATAGYFNNTDDDLNLTVDDLIWVQASDGNAWFRVSAISSGSVTLQFAGGNLPIQTFATGTAGAITKLSVGYYEVSSTIATATRAVLPTPYPGAEVMAVYAASGSGGHSISFDAGASASNVSVGNGGGTGVVYDQSGHRRIRLSRIGESFHVVGTSTSRWRIQSLSYRATGASASAGGGGSAVLLGT